MIPAYGVWAWCGVKFWASPLTCIVALTTLALPCDFKVSDSLHSQIFLLSYLNFVTYLVTYYRKYKHVDAKPEVVIFHVLALVEEKFQRHYQCFHWRQNVSSSTYPYTIVDGGLLNGVNAYLRLRDIHNTHQWFQWLYCTRLTTKQHDCHITHRMACIILLHALYFRLLTYGIISCNTH